MIKTYTWDSINRFQMKTDNLGMYFSNNGEYIIQFGGNSELTSYDIPEGCKVIADSCFTIPWEDTGEINLRNINLPNSIEAIGDKAFYGCSLVETIVLPKSVKCINGNPFPDMMKVISESPYFQIDNNILYDINKIKIIHCFSDDGEVVIPQTVEEIASYAFRGCKKLRTIILPKSIQVIGDYAFSCCSSLHNVIVQCKIKQIPDGLFRGSGIYSFDIGEEVEQIGCSSFSDCNNLREIVFNNNVSKIGSYAFKGDTSLQEIVLPQKLTIVEQGLFENCTSLRQITIPDGVKCIGAYAFQKCTSIYKIVLPESLEWIGDKAFEGCTSLTELVMPRKLKSIGYRAFASCKSLTKVIISESLEEINREVFTGCKSLKKIIIPNNIKSIHSDAFAYSGLSDIRIPDSVKYLGQSAFSGCENLTSIMVPGSISTIPEFCFHGCISLTRVTLFEGIKKIEDYAFDSCPKLKRLLIPEGVTDLDDVFESTRLEHLYVPSTLSPIVPYNSWNEDNGYANLHVPLGMGKKANEEADSFFEKYDGFEPPQSIREYAIKDHLIYEIEDSESSLIVEDYNDPFLGGSITIPKNITYNGKHYKVKAIAKNAFYNSFIEKIDVSEGIEYIGSHAFSYCGNLRKIEIPSSLTTIDGELFYDCINLESIYVGYDNQFFLSINGVLYSKDVKRIIAYPNSYKDEYEIIEGTEIIEDYAFKSCRSLRSLKLPNTLKTIGSNAFYGCTSLQTVRIPDGIERISTLQERTSTIFEFKGKEYTSEQIVHIMNKCNTK